MDHVLVNSATLVAAAHASLGPLPADRAGLCAEALWLEAQQRQVKIILAELPADLDHIGVR